MNLENKLKNSTTFVLTKKEINFYFKTPIVYVVAIFFIFMLSLLFIGTNTWFYAGQSDFKSFFLNIPLLFCIIIPMLTMNAWADEKKQFTDKLLFALPISTSGIVAGKYLSLIFIWFILLLISTIIPLSVFSLGYFSIASFVLSLFSVFLFGSGVMAISLGLSSLSKHSAINFLISFMSISFFTLIHFAIQYFESNSFIANTINYFSFIRHFESAARGIFDSRDFIFYFILIIFGFELNTFILQSQRNSR